MSGPRSFAGYRRDTAAAEAVRLDLNEAPREPAEAFRARVLELLAAAPWRRYPDMDVRGAREAAARLYGWPVEGTLVGNGSNELLAAAIRVLLPRGGTLFSLAPSFSMYPVLAQRQGATLLVLRLAPPDFEADREALLALAARADVALLCSPNNPTGGELDAETISRVAALGRPVLWDGAYLDFGSTDPHPLLRRHDNLAVLRSLSKAWAVAGLRVGALLASPALAERIAAELLPFDSGWLVAACFRAADELREDGRRLVAETVAERDRQVAAIAALPGFEVVSSAGNFYLVRRGGLAGGALAEALRQAGFAARVIDTLAAEGYVRLSIGTRAEGDALLAVLAEVANG